jgi:C4-dicarboxylate transporter, DctM subunit
MSPQLIGGIGVCGLFSLLIIRVPVWAALMLVGFLGNVALIGVRAAPATLGTIPFDTASLYGLSVIPLFILTGQSRQEPDSQRSFSRLRE